jgi:tetratricopeptide (TPR) repeat protein
MKTFSGFVSVRVLTLMLLGLAGLLGQSSDPLAKAEELYRRTDYRASLTLARENGRATAQATFLVGRDYYMLGDYKRAAEALERALALEPSNSELAWWLGRSFVRRAELASPFFGAGYASKARAYLEKAVALDPNNEAALRDLFDYYLEAPGSSGSGYDKAERVAQEIAARNPAEGHFVETQLADRRKQFDTTEEQLRRVLNLARELARGGRIAQSEAAFDRAEQIAPDSLGKVSLERARIYVEQRRNLDQAEALLNQYLRSNLKPDDPSREQAERLLKEAALLHAASGA